MEEYTPVENQEQPQIQEQPQKQVKTIPAKIFYPVMAAAIILALLLGTAGGFFGASLFDLKNNLGAEKEGSSVIYETVESEGATVVSGDLPGVVAKVKNSVVEITTEQTVTGSFMQQYVSEGAGSGVIISKDGYIVTNHHVIDGATNITVRLADGQEYTAKLIGSDAKTDLAVIKIEAQDLTPAVYGKSTALQVGEQVIAVGNPLGELGGTVTQGIISAMDRAIVIDDTTMYLLQTDTAINPGNSGGGMFNLKGQLVGVVNAKSAGEEIEGLGFAIPIDTARTVVEELINNGYVTGRVDPGITFVEINDGMTAAMYRVNALGLYVWEVAEGSDAAKAGLRPADYIVSIDGKELTTAAEANAIFDGKKVGDKVKIVVMRNKQETFEITLSEYKPQ